MINFLIIEGCNFIDCPVGGQLSFVKQLISVYGEEVGLVGVTNSSKIPIGKWIKVRLDNKEFDFFAFRRISCNGKKPIIPSRISNFLAIKRYRSRIISKNKNAITQAPELLIAIKEWKWNSLCYLFPGVENPLKMPRYKWGIFFANYYEKQFFHALQKIDLILASAGFEEIKKLAKRSKGKLKFINQFPTRVDTSFFKPISVDKKRLVGVCHSDIILVVCGRINKVKGWQLILDSFKIIKKEIQNIQLYYVGDGEDRELLEKRAKQNKLLSSVHIVGYQRPSQVRIWLNISNLVLVGSFKEGWSISMLETLACGKAIVSTDVSGAKELINEGENGFIVESRNPYEYAKAIRKGLDLKNVQEKSLEIVSDYALSSLKEDLDKIWLREKYIID